MSRLEEVGERILARSDEKMGALLERLAAAARRVLEEEALDAATLLDDGEDDDARELRRAEQEYEAQERQRTLGLIEAISVRNRQRRSGP